MDKRADDPHRPAAELHPPAAERRTNHRLRFLIGELQSGIAENRLDVRALTGRLNELAKEVAELKRQLSGNRR